MDGMFRTSVKTLSEQSLDTVDLHSDMAGSSSDNLSDGFRVESFEV
jgi:hypothetical protein